MRESPRSILVRVTPRPGLSVPSTILDATDASTIEWKSTAESWPRNADGCCAISSLRVAPGRALPDPNGISNSDLEKKLAGIFDRQFLYRTHMVAELR